MTLLCDNVLSMLSRIFRTLRRSPCVHEPVGWLRRRCSCGLPLGACPDRTAQLLAAGRPARTPEGNEGQRWQRDPPAPGRAGRPGYLPQIAGKTNGGPR